MERQADGDGSVFQRVQDRQDNGKKARADGHRSTPAVRRFPDGGR